MKEWKDNVNRYNEESDGKKMGYEMEIKVR